MSSWNNEQQQYMMQNMMGMNPMVPNMMPPGNIPSLMPPMYGPPPGAAMPYGVPPPSNDTNKNVAEKPKDHSRDPRIDNKDYAKQRDLGAKRSNQQDNDRNNKNDRNSKNRKKSKWDSGGNDNNWPAQQPDNPSLPGAGVYGPGPGNMMMPGNMMPYGPPGPMMPPMDMAGMPGVMANMANPNLPAIPNLPVMPNMMPGMNMLMMNQPMPTGANNQAIYVVNAALLPPLPNTSLPVRSERPPDCKTIFVGGFPSNVTKEIINEMFARFGKIADIKLNKQGVAQVKFDNSDAVEQAFFFSGSRFRYIDQLDTEASTIFIDYVANSNDQSENEKIQQQSPVHFEPCTQTALNNLAEKIKSNTEFSEAAPTLEGWIQRGECNRKNANTFYNLIQASNGHLRRLYDEKMKIDEEYNTMKSSLKEKFAVLLKQFELVAKILTAAKNQRVSDYFSKQQRKNIEMWLKMTEEVTHIQEEFNSLFDDEDAEHGSKKTIALEKYEELKKENEKLRYEFKVQLEGYKNEVHLAKDEAERKFEKYKAQYSGQNSMQQIMGQIYPPLPPTPKMVEPPLPAKPEPPTPDEVTTSGQAVSVSEAKIISAITAYLLIHPNGAVVDHIVPYIKIMCPFVTQGTVNHVLQKYSDVFMKKKFGKGINTEFRWCFAMFDRVKIEGK